MAKSLMSPFGLGKECSAKEARGVTKKARIKRNGSVPFFMFKNKRMFCSKSREMGCVPF